MNQVYTWIIENMKGKMTQRERDELNTFLRVISDKGVV